MFFCKKDQFMSLALFCTVLFLPLVSSAQEAVGSGTRFKVNTKNVVCGTDGTALGVDEEKDATIVPSKEKKGDRNLTVHIALWPPKGGYSGTDAKAKAEKYSNCRHTIKHGYARTYTYTNISIGPVAIPVVYRRSADVEGFKGEIGSEFKVGAYWKYAFKGWATVNHVRFQEPKIYRKSELSIAALVSVGSAKFKIPGTETENTIAVIAPGVGAVFGYRSFDIGAFAGWDLGVGPNQSKWKYNAWNRGWGWKGGLTPGWFGLSIGFDSFKTNLFK